ncbi:MAG: M28 family metallopeptidase [Desulfitobacterium sp.]
MRKNRHGFLLIVIILFVFCSLTVKENIPPQAGQVASMPSRGVTEFSADKAYEHIRHLTENIGPRPAGSKNEQKAAQYLYYILEQQGWKVREQPFSKIVVPNNPLVPENRIQVISSRNIIAELPGEQPETILLGAHYDSADVSAPGAVDNASGVGVLLEIARVLGQEKHEKSYQIVFFGAEESGLVGSSYFTAQSDMSAIQWMLNVDMVGAPLEIDIAGKTSSPPELVQQVVRIARQEQIPFHVSRDFAVMTREGSQGGNSDFSPFLDQSIPALGLGIAGRADGYYHRPEDRIEKVTLQSIETMGQLIPKLVEQVSVTGSGQKSWDAYYLPFQLGSYLFIIPTLGLRFLFVMGIFFTIYTIVQSLRTQDPLYSGDFKGYTVMGIGIPLAAVFVSFISGIGEWLWQLAKGRVFVWQAYPEVFLALRIMLLVCTMVIAFRILRSLPRPKEGKLYWLVGTLMLLLLTIVLGLYRIDLAFPFLFWLICFNLLRYFPSMIWVLIGPYFIYKVHWELLNSQQWSSFYETLHVYPLVFILLYGMLLIPVLLGGLYVIEQGKRPWAKILQKLWLPALIGGVSIILGSGLIPSYSKAHPQPVRVQTIWSDGETVKLGISGSDTLPPSLIKGLDAKGLRLGIDRRTLELPIPTETAPLQARVSVTDTGERILNFKMSMKYSREPYSVKIKLESQKPFTILEMDDFVPVSKLPRKISLEGKEYKGTYSLILERTPPHLGALQWKISAPGIVHCKVEILLADPSPRYVLEIPQVSPNYEEVYLDAFEF